MNNLLYEFRKINNRPIFCLLFVILLGSCIIFPSYYVYQNKGDIDAIDKLYLQYKDINLTKANCQEINNKYYDNGNILKQNIGNELFDVYYAREYRRTGKIQGIVYQELYEQQGEIISTNTIKQRLSELEKNHTTNTYEFINLKLQSKMMENAGIPNLVFKGFWKMFDINETITVFLFAFLIIFIISPIFSNEYKYRMYMLIDSSIYSKKNNVTLKIMLGYLISICGVLIINITMGFIYLILGSYKGYDTNMVSFGINYSQTPYSLSILQYALIKIGYQCLSMMALISFITFISFKFKSNLLAFILGIFALCSGFFYIVLNGSQRTLLSFLSITNGLYTQKVFSHYVSFRLLNRPVLYPFVLIIMLIVIMITFNILIYIYYNKRIMNNVPHEN